MDLSPALDVSKKVIRADNRLETLNGYNGSTLNITIIDTGINSNHPDLNDLDDDPNTNDPKVTQEISFVDWNNDGVPDVGPMDNNGHGTHVAGIAAGTGESSGYQYTGIAPGAWLWNYKALETLQWIWDPIWQRMVPDVRGQEDDIVRAIDTAVAAGADIINLSLGGAGGDGTSSVSRAADRAVASGVVVVAAAGNNGPNPQTIDSPGDAFNVITVGAIDDHNTQSIHDDIVAGFSSRGPTGDDRTKPDAMAPGENIIAPIDQGSEIWRTFPEFRVGNFYARLSGTSMATPHIAGVAALLLQAYPSLSPDVLKSVIMGTARLNDNLQQNTENDRGKGIVDAERALKCLTEVPVDQADSKHEDGSPPDFYEAKAYLNGTYNVVASGRFLLNAWAAATLQKSFVPEHNISNPTFLFEFIDTGFFSVYFLGTANFTVLLKLWDAVNELFAYSEIIHCAMDLDVYDTHCSHTINHTYEGVLLAGHTYDIEYGFEVNATAYDYNGFAIADFTVQALSLGIANFLGPGNPGFEERLKSVYEPAYWSINQDANGWRELIGDINGDKYVGIDDIVTVAEHFGTSPSSPNWDPRCDINGDDYVGTDDIVLVAEDYGKYTICLEGSYSWFVNETLYLSMTQWLCDFDVKAARGNNITFGFWFNPMKSTDAKAEIFYVDDSGNHTISGEAPIKIGDWYKAAVKCMLPETTTAIRVMIQGWAVFPGPVNFTSRIDYTWIDIQY